MLTPSEAVEKGLLDADAVVFDGLDEAIVGYGGQYSDSQLVVYDKDKLIEALMSNGVTYDEAYEWYSFNIECLWVGPKTPIIVRTE